MCRDNNEQFDDLLKFGSYYNFWSYGQDSVVEISKFNEFKDLKWSNSVFAKFLHDSLSSPELESNGEWGSLSALLAWAYSLKLTQSEKESEIRSKSKNLVPKNWNEFERLAISKPISEICRGLTQWTPTKYWLVAFGMVFESKDSFNPIPQRLYEVVASNIKKESNKENDIENLIVTFRNECPFLPGGKFGRVWANHVREVTKDRKVPDELDCPNDSDTLVLSEQECFVLSLFERKGIIKLGIRNDSPRRFLMNFPTLNRQISFYQNIGASNE